MEVWCRGGKERWRDLSYPGASRVAMVAKHNKLHNNMWESRICRSWRARSIRRLSYISHHDNIFIVYGSFISSVIFLSFIGSTRWSPEIYRQERSIHHMLCCMTLHKHTFIGNSCHVFCIIWEVMVDKTCVLSCRNDIKAENHVRVGNNILHNIMSRRIQLTKK